MNWYKKAQSAEIYLWLDDERNPKDPFIQENFGATGREIWVKTPQEAKALLDTGNVVSASLDHDLGEGIPDGYQVAKYIEEGAFRGTIPEIRNLKIHSQNSGARQKMTQALQSAQRFWERNRKEGETKMAQAEKAKKLIINRGPSGSGKSSLIKQIIEEEGNAFVFSTDDYWKQNPEGQYKFDPSKLGEAHEWNKRRAEEAMKEGKSPIVIDNTNLVSSEFRPYLEMGKKYGYEMHLKEPNWHPNLRTKDRKWNFDFIKGKNTHGVPDETVRRMINKYEYDLTPEKILGEEKTASISNDELYKIITPDWSSEPMPAQKALEMLKNIRGEGYDARIVKVKNIDQMTMASSDQNFVQEDEALLAEIRKKTSAGNIHSVSGLLQHYNIALDTGDADLINKVENALRSFLESGDAKKSKSMVEGLYRAWLQKKQYELV